MHKKIIALCALLFCSSAWSGYHPIPELPQWAKEHFKNTPRWDVSLKMYVGIGHDGKALGIYQEKIGIFNWATKDTPHSQFKPMKFNERPRSFPPNNSLFTI